MRNQSGLIGSPPEFEMGVDTPMFDGGERSTFADPTDATVEHAVLGIFNDLPREVQGIVTRVAMELLRNAQAFAKPQPGQFRFDAPTHTLVLGWTMDGGYRYPLVAMDDVSHKMPAVQVSTRTGLKRVISQTFRCGAHRTADGKRVWAVVDSQKR